MNNFLQYDSWWTQKYKDKIASRFATAKLALNLLYQRGGKTIIETGTTRATEDFAGAGMATIFFGDYAAHYNAHLWTVDILPQAIALSQTLTSEFQTAITYVTGDSVAFLTDFPDPIDLLYLDSVDCPIDDTHPDELEFSQQHQLKELKAAYDKLHDTSIVLLDDNNFSNGGKCKYSIPYLEEKGWICLFADKQMVWIR